MRRRDFLKAGTVAGTYFVGSTRTHLLAAPQSEPAKPISANDHIQIALIGAGGRGQQDLRNAARVPGVKVMAVADCYDGRLQRLRELYGNDLFTTREYPEIYARKDIDAVIVGTPDHWHMQASIDAMNAGKDVYCEKPMIHLHSDGPKIIETWQRTKRIMQVGSQRVSSILYLKAKELLASGAIGTLNMVTAWWDRNSSQGAWNATIPDDASTTTCDWPRFLGTAPQIPFKPEHFFQWRKWSAYGSGVAGDLFVHLFSGVNFVTNTHGPTRGFATGGLRFWKDGRDAPDVMMALFDYPQGFNLDLRTNFVDGGAESEGFVFTGSEGSLTIGGGAVTLSRVPRKPDNGPHAGQFAEAIQKRMMASYQETHPAGMPPVGAALQGEEKYVAPQGYDDNYDHFVTWVNSIRSRQPLVEDPIFGYRAAGAALLSSLSYNTGHPAPWDPEAMKLL